MNVDLKTKSRKELITNKTLTIKFTKKDIKNGVLECDIADKIEEIQNPFVVFSNNEDEQCSLDITSFIESVKNKSTLKFDLNNCIIKGNWKIAVYYSITKVVK